MKPTVKFAIIGLAHRHVYGMTENLLSAGGEIAGYALGSDQSIVNGFNKRFPEIVGESEKQAILENEDIDAVVIVAEPKFRAALAIEAMRHGKDVMVDKPGCLTLNELKDIQKCVAETGRIWSVNFSERFEVRAVTKATELVERGEIGEVVQTVGIGPHRLNAHSRPAWFFDSKNYGGILTDIASHQIDQFLHFTKKGDAKIVHASIDNVASAHYPNFEDFGELNLLSGKARGYVRVDWFTPDALPNWGDGRLFLLGNQGYIELRKYVDVAGKEGTDHLYLCNGDRMEYIDCSDQELPYFEAFLADVANRTETACGQEHTFTVSRLAIEAQTMAEARAR